MGTIRVLIIIILSLNLGMTYGDLKNNNGKVAICNKIFGEIIYNYMVSRMENKNRK